VTPVSGLRSAPSSSAASAEPLNSAQAKRAIRASAPPACANAGPVLLRFGRFVLTLDTLFQCRRRRPCSRPATATADIEHRIAIAAVGPADIGRIFDRQACRTTLSYSHALTTKTHACLIEQNQQLGDLYGLAGRRLSVNIDRNGAILTEIKIRLSGRRTAPGWRET
jgi:hypothetical protein